MTSSHYIDLFCMGGAIVEKISSDSYETLGSDGDKSPKDVYQLSAKKCQEVPLLHAKHV
jgi:hypothetical protein